jgi:hypothetical protein
MLQHTVNLRYRSSFRGGVHLVSARSLTVVSKNLSAGRGELFPMLLKAAQHGEIALIQHRAAVPLGISRASAPLQFGTAILRHGSTEKEKATEGRRQGDI